MHTFTQVFIHATHTSMHVGTVLMHNTQERDQDENKHGMWTSVQTSRVTDMEGTRQWAIKYAPKIICTPTPPHKRTNSTLSLGCYPPARTRPHSHNGRARRVRMGVHNFTNCVMCTQHVITRTRQELRNPCLSKI